MLLQLIGYPPAYEAVAWQVSIFNYARCITIEGKELEIAFNVKFLQDGLETITTKNVIIEAMPIEPGSSAFGWRGGEFIHSDADDIDGK